MNILNKIVVDKRKEVAAKKLVLPIDFLQKSPLFARENISLVKSIKLGSGIIAEFKRRSPSKQVINQNSSVIDVVKGYEKAGVSGISILTDTKYFGGAIDDLLQARNETKLPILRKEFIIDAYQIYEAKALGADAILLIAAILSKDEIIEFSRLAHQIGLEVLLEIHNEEELKKSDLTFIDLVGVNNRNLKTFETSLKISKSLSESIPSGKVKISESGISSIEAIQDLKQYGFEGFLIGENFMKTDNPGEAAAKFLKTLEVKIRK
ncbi:MAG: indole-3-glycerol phosphate synthase TrpC [Flavobacteriaceae bacterium]|nr:indole-3-glycerol phosphate synthase TrpC [Flavobacteriaceae bacterium]